MYARDIKRPLTLRQHRVNGSSIQVNKLYAGDISSVFPNQNILISKIPMCDPRLVHLFHFTTDRIQQGHQALAMRIITIDVD